MKKVIFLLTFLFISNSVFSQIEATTKDGKIVLLNVDGTWKYIGTQKKNDDNFKVEKVTEFETTHMSTYGSTTKMKAKITLFTDKLVIEHIYTEKMKKMLGDTALQNTKVTYPYRFTKEEKNGILVYSYQDNSTRIIVTVSGPKIKPAVAVNAKDDFSGRKAEVIYFSL